MRAGAASCSASKRPREAPLTNRTHRTYERSGARGYVSSSRNVAGYACSIFSAVIPGRATSREPGIQSRLLDFRIMDSGSAPRGASRNDEWEIVRWLWVPAFAGTTSRMLMHAVIPGRATPGIHGHQPDFLQSWIPGLRRAAHPGMTCGEIAPRLSKRKSGGSRLRFSYSCRMVSELTPAVPPRGPAGCRPARFPTRGGCAAPPARARRARLHRAAARTH